MSQRLPQICTASAYVQMCGILKQRPHKFAVHFGSMSTPTSYVELAGMPALKSGPRLVGGGNAPLD